jgi:hypothetical protein
MNPASLQAELGSYLAATLISEASLESILP